MKKKTRQICDSHSERESENTQMMSILAISLRKKRKNEKKRMLIFSLMIFGQTLCDHSQQNLHTKTNGLNEANGRILPDIKKKFNYNDKFIFICFVGRSCFFLLVSLSISFFCHCSLSIHRKWLKENKQIHYAL